MFLSNSRLDVRECLFNGLPGRLNWCGRDFVVEIKKKKELKNIFLVKMILIFCM